MSLPQRRPEGTARILHTSDWHLGMSRWFLDADAQPRFDEARLAAVERLFDIARSRDCEAIVVAGDVFDSNFLEPRTWRRALDVLRRTPVPLYLLPGNHDSLDPSSVYRQPEFEGLEQGGSAGVRVLRNSEAQEVRPGLVIIGAPLLSRYGAEDVVGRALSAVREDCGAAPPGEARVLVGHGRVQSWGSEMALDVIDVDGAVAACEQRLVDYIALGDTHSAMRLHDSGRAWYSGSPEVTDYREEDGTGEAASGFALIVDIAADPLGGDSPAKVAVEQVPVGQWTFAAVDGRMDGPEDVQALVERLDRFPHPRTTVVKYGLEGTIDLATSGKLERQLDELRPKFAALYPRHSRDRVHVVPGESEIAEAFPTAGVVGRVAEELSLLAQTTPEAEDALKLLYRLSHTQDGK
ncbi:Nuclease SbcCD subunit D [Corynebacterium heidelbergense]|uniref:metallophosphoesterase family protein n=1 Tax=Corynebacterium heidelbergense TaxID=2055947 RepID=UPI002359C3AF|nr:metallophosphoesterase [Corynebacterium heidelbergense]WCZ36916.1 Nuclease SbcCD subunit D [Corynebacterium heidelbergense]